MPARLSLTDVQRTALLTLPETEEAVCHERKPEGFAELYGR
jgi:hypothetical protein